MILMINVRAFFSDRRVRLSLIILVAFLGLWMFFKDGNERSGYIFGKVEQSDITEVVSESGVVQADGAIPLYSPTRGLVTQVAVANGDFVAKGQKLFVVESSATSQEKQAAYAAYLAAKATLAADTASLFTLQSQMLDAWKSYTDLSQNATYQNADKSPNLGNRTAAEFIASQSRWRASEDAYKNQQNVLSKDRAALQSAWDAYQATQNATVLAPTKGYVSNLAVNVGNAVEAQTVLTPAPTPVLLVKNSDEPVLVLAVGQSNISKVAAGQEVTITPDAQKGAEFSGTVLRVDDVGTNTLGVTVYNVYLEASTEGKLKAGMTFDAEIVTKKVSNVLSLPNSAIVQDQGRPSVRVFQNGKVEFLPVGVGVKGQRNTEITEGLTLGQEVIIGLTNEKAERPGFLGL